MFTLVLVVSVLVACYPLTPVLATGKKPPAATIGKIFILSPKSNKVVASGNAITIRYNINDADITSVKISVSNGQMTDIGTAGMNEARVFLFPGVNKIQVAGYKSSELDSVARATIEVECNSECISGARPPGGMVQSVSLVTPPPVASPSPTPGPTQSAPKNIAVRVAATVNAPTVEPTVVVQEKSGISRLIVDVYQNGHRIDSAEPKIDYSDGFAVANPKLKIAEGVNEIRAFDPRHFGEEGYFTSSSLTCAGDKCVAAGQTAAEQPKKPATAITILGPTKPPEVNASSIHLYLKVPEGINKLKYEVLTEKTAPLIETIDVPAKAREELPVSVKIVEGTNTISFFNAEAPEKTEQRVAINVTCKGEKCPPSFEVADFSSSGQNRRVIVGFEQAGGSSAPSETKPILDFFFMSPFIFDPQKDCDRDITGSGAEQVRKREKCNADNLQKKFLPRFGFWGDIRLAATPEQVGAAQVFPTSLVNQVDKAGKAVDLVQSFDFLAGVEGRIRTSNGSFWSPIPGVRQKMSLYFAAGWGAISPLTARKESLQIFNIPGPNDARRAEFVNRYGTPPDGKEFIALTPIDRDRFLHQWYAGLRLKTFYCEAEDPDCIRGFQNSFPAIVDFMFGQNEAVTGGSRQRGGTPDPNNPNKLIGQSNSYILRIDGFYPFPIKKANFVFFYGTAMMKVGGGGVKITTPLFLDNPGTTVQISDTKVYIPATNILKLQQPDRDYYKIGVGINLTDLFNRKSSH